MSDGPLGRLLALFVAPAPGGASASRVRDPSAPTRSARRRRDRTADRGGMAPTVAPATTSLAVLGAPGDVRAAAVAARLTGRGTVVLACWTPGGGRLPVRRPATPGAKRLAGALARRGTPTTAAGRLVVAALPDDPLEAVAAARRLEAAAADVPVALALAGPRDEAWDPVLGERDVVLLAGQDPALLELAADGLAGVVAVARVRRCALPAGLRGRGLRRAVRGALGGRS